MKTLKTKKLALSALFIAIIAASAWISIPTPFGVNMTLSLFGVCLTAFVLGAKYALASTMVYIVLGAIGLPIFSQFTGGFGVLFGMSGGFLWGFLAVAVLCGIVKNAANTTIKYAVMILSVIVCHVAGVAQYSVVTGNNLWISFLSASLPFLLKDLLLVFFAVFVSKKIKI